MRRSLLVSVLCAPVLAGCLIIDADTQVPERVSVEAPMHRHARGPVGYNTQALMLNAAGQEIGRASFTEGPMGVLIQIDLAPGSLTPGWHGVHFHAVGSCHDHSAGFTASSGHLGRGESVTHGFLSANGPEAGDLPNLFVPASGPIRAEFFSHFVTLGEHDLGPHRLALQDGDGAALVIHADPDDYSSQPVGMAGARVACGVLARG
jgi:superoxide dismutase, Cu-Zn family